MALGPGFVQTRGTQFVVNGERFPAVGVNCYFLGYCTDAARQAALDAILPTGATVVRAAAFLNHAAQPADGVTFQYGSGGSITVNDGIDGLGRLDALIEAAEQRELRLILPLVNYWPDLGGMDTYLGWLFPGETLRTEEFYRRPEARAAFKNWIAHVLDRISTRTGRPYRDSPAILAWELANEPRCPLRGGRELLLDWIGEMARFVKQHDPNHLVAAGDEGFFARRGRPWNRLYNGWYGVDFDAILEIPEIDFGTYHFYPSPKAMNVPNAFGEVWIEDHIAAGLRADKPVLLEEYGLRAGEDRDLWYGRWLDTVHALGGAGDLLWMMGSREPDVGGNRDDYTVYSAAEIPPVVAHIRKMRA